MADIEYLIWSINPTTEYHNPGGLTGDIATDLAKLTHRSGPAFPLVAELEAAEVIYQADQSTDSATWASIKTGAGSAVGINYEALTAIQVRSLFAILLYRTDALDKNGNVRPLAEWIRE